MADIDLDTVLTTDPPKPNWLVPDILSKGSMIILAGDAGVGKSMLCYCLAMSVASGLPFLGRQTSADRILYFDEENSQHDSHTYLKRVWLGMGCPQIELLKSNFRMCSFSLTHMYQAEIIRASAETKPALIVIDTANAACRIDDENDNAKASVVIKSLRMAKLASGRADCTMLILKHARVTHDKSGNYLGRDIRGAKAWKGELDGMIIHTASRGRPWHGNYRRTTIWPHKSRAFGLLRPIGINPIAIGEGVCFEPCEPDPDVK